MRLVTLLLEKCAIFYLFFFHLVPCDAIELTSLQCVSNKTVDLLFLIDESDHVENYAHILQFVREIVDYHLTTNTRVGVLTYNDSVTTHFDFEDFESLGKVSGWLEDLSKTPSGGGSDARKAVERVKEIFETQSN